MFRFLSRCSFVVVAMTASIALANDAPAEGAPAEGAAPKPYPLQTCIVTDARLGSMGDPAVVVYKGQEVKFCCDHCIEPFKKDPDKYLGKMNEAAKQQPTTQPAEAE